MVGFSCFQTHIHSHRSKKTVQPSAEATHRTFQDCSEDQALKVSSIPTSLNPLRLKLYEDNSSIISAEQVKSSSSVECCSKSEGMDSRFSPEANIEAHQMVRLKKSQSLGSGLDREGGVSCGIDTEDEIDQGFSCDDSHEKNYHGMFDVLDNSGLEEPFDSKDAGMNSLNQYQVTVTGEHFQVNSDMAHNQTIFSVGDLEQLEREGHEDFATLLSSEHANNSGHHTPTTQAMIAKSRSLPDLGVCRPHSGEGSSSPIYEGPDYRSSDDLDVLNAKRKEFLNQEGGSHAMANQERDNSISRSEKDKCGNSLGNGYDSCNFIGVVNDGTTVGMNRVDMIENLQGESSFHRWEKMPTKDFKIKRIEEWVSMIDLQERSAVEETNQLVHSTEKVKKGSIALGAMTSGKLDSKISLGMEAAKNYLSSLTATSTSAQLANFGLVVIPFLSAYVSLRVLNLSGNSIVRITAGALPRGLHMLNLSKNNISTIEGLRELTRLRVLDLSYNRIFRIGHGLASCSSLKELYLAGNKISEVEGLHRLLKLNVLDLRFNKISTAKCLGQLAANYSSLQAISLEGNPAQRNVGDEQLKKYLQGLLPHLVYFNRQPIKASSSKEIADRPVRSALTVHKFDSGMRSEHKHIRKGSHSVATHKPSSSNHGRTNQAMSSPKRSKSRNGHLPPSGTKGTTDHRHHYLDLGSKLQSLRSGLSMHRSRSEGNLGAS